MSVALEKYLTNIPMYRLVNGCLLLLLGVATIAGGIGILTFTALEIIVTTAVFCAVGVASSYGIARLYGLSSHLPSALITSLILAALYTPTFEVRTLLLYGLIAVIAQASKFILCYRSRHIFNPAVFGAVIGGLVFSTYASWWIANPILLPCILVTGFLVLYKSRLIIIGKVFLAISIPLTVIVSQQSLITVLASWPLVFLACFMLSEPLTLPIKKVHRYIVGGIVAVTVSIPFSAGWLYGSPELALLIGNAVAFALSFRQRATYTLTLKSRRSVAPNVEEFTFISDRPPLFTAGQYLEISLPHVKVDVRGTRRAFSLVRVSGHEIVIAVKFYERSSSFKKALRSLSIGSVVRSTGITGDFTPNSDEDLPVTYIAAGIGITPFISHLQDLGSNTKTVTVLYFANNSSEFAYKDFLDTSGATVHYFVAQNPQADMQHAAYFNPSIADAYMKDKTFTFISGPPAMVANAKRIVKSRGNPVKTDYFSGY